MCVFAVGIVGYDFLFRSTNPKMESKKIIRLAGPNIQIYLCCCFILLRNYNQPTRRVRTHSTKSMVSSERFRVGKFTLWCLAMPTSSHTKGAVNVTAMYEASSTGGWCVGGNFPVSFTLNSVLLIFCCHESQ